MEITWRHNYCTWGKKLIKVIKMIPNIYIIVVEALVESLTRDCFIANCGSVVTHNSYKQHQ